MRPTNIGIEKALEKIKHFCAYQERSHSQVKEKLYSFGLYKSEVEQLLSQLIEENFLNEERYATAFASGKFRIKHWGKIKIRHELRQNKISEYCINAALNAIDSTDYNQTLQRLYDAKQKALKEEKNPFVKKQKTMSYLMQKGFEPALVHQLFKKEN